MSPAYSAKICLHEPQGATPSVVTTDIAIKLVYPWDNAEKIATLSAHRVVGYAFYSILTPIIILLSYESSEDPTG